MLKYFGEEEGKSKLEEFFATWQGFLQSFNEVKTEIKVKKQRELDEKKHKEDGIMTSKLIQSRKQTINILKNEIDDSNCKKYLFLYCPILKRIKISEFKQTLLILIFSLKEFLIKFFSLIPTFSI